MKTIQSVIKKIMHSPVKSFLTLFTVGLGVGVLILSLSISSFFSRTIKEQLENSGIVLTFANAEYSEEMGLEPVRPSQFRLNILDTVKTEIEGITAAAPVSNPFWNVFMADGEPYNIRTVYGTTTEYADVMNLNITYGSFFTDEDVENGIKAAVISEELAEILFGTASNAMGKVITPPANTGAGDGGGGGSTQGGAGGTRSFVRPSYTITGIYETPDEIQRGAYNVADMVIPFTAILPQGMNLEMAERFLLSTIVVKVEGAKPETIEAQLREVLSRTYGDDLQLFVWEGTPSGETALLEETRNSVATFSLIVNLLGFVLLVTGSIGILSIMLVEVLGRSREMALERAVGASKGNIIKEFFTRGVIISTVSAIIGIILSLIFAVPLQKLLLPIFNGINVSEVSGMVLNPVAVLIGSASAILIGGIFGVLPVFSTLKIAIAEGIRDV